MKVGFIGLGTMGASMASNLQKEPRRSKPYFCEPASLPHGATNLAKHSPPGRGAPGAWSPSPWRRPWDHARGVQNPRLRLAQGRSEAGGQTPADPSG
jgi:NAD binding domain of 6-phosphogluconate dehydrogenase